VGLTGGIGSGKSTVARRLVARGAVLVDSDVLAREVVAPGTEGLAEVVDAFGPDVLDPSGALDRPALAAVVFGDPAARALLNAIIHPRVRERSAELIAAAPADAVVVQDIPLLVESGMAPQFSLVVVVHADVEERVRRLALRGTPEADARSRIAAQASDADRRAAADVWLSNDGSQAELEAAVDALWERRLVPFEVNLRERRIAQGAPGLVAPDPEWAAAGERLRARVAAAAGSLGRGVAHVGPTAVPGLPAADVIDLQLGVGSLDDADAVRDALQDTGFPQHPSVGHDPVRPERLHGSADPGRPVALHVRVVDSPGWREALLLRDWLRADADARAEYVARTRTAAGAATGDTAADRAAELQEPWSRTASERAESWAATSAWVPSLD
jgi:dephospho-CoA kinase